ncbi:hypothetical protein SO802_000607 [Lithocarpus litseifolius]|uniref:Uncharacterized protein n=1 Tax=Lithocarpus litseifolius TaxID=425828 RepID=A0AAW2DVF6_9ROSI
MAGRPFKLLSDQPPPLHGGSSLKYQFEKAVASSGLDFDPASLDGKDWGALDLFRQFLFYQTHLSQPNTLARFRGMIQDMLGNEFYVGAFKDDGDVWITSKFIDVCFIAFLLKVSSALFFNYNTSLGPPFRVLVDTNFINFSI